MKTKLLKMIRADQRYFIFHKGKINGYSHSGYWYLLDIVLGKKLSHKRLKECLSDYLFFINHKKKMAMYKLIVFACLIFMLFFFSCCDQEPQRTEIWNPYTSDVSGDSININEKMILLEISETKNDSIN